MNESPHPSGVHCIVTNSKLYMRYLKNKLALVALLSFGLPWLTSAQLGLELSGEGLLGLQTQELEIYESPVTDHQSYGFRTGAALTYSFFDESVESILWLGYKRLDFSARHEDTDLSGYTQKALVRLGARYFFSEQWAAGIYLSGSNNRDTDDFRASTSDNFRFGAELEGLYRFNSWLGVTASVHHVLYPTADLYLLSNAPMHLQAGLNFNIW